MSHDEKTCVNCGEGIGTNAPSGGPRSSDAPKKPAVIDPYGGRVHYLKTWPFPFEDVIAGRKPFEYRRFDRDFRVGDTLVLEKYDPHTKAYAGASVDRHVTYVLPGGTFGVPDGYCVLGLREPIHPLEAGPRSAEDSLLVCVHGKSERDACFIGGCHRYGINAIQLADEDRSTEAPKGSEATAISTGRRQEVIEQLCKMMTRAYNTIDPHAHEASDCVCRSNVVNEGDKYRNAGHALTFMEEAVSAHIAKYEREQRSADDQPYKVGDRAIYQGDEVEVDSVESTPGGWFIGAKWVGEDGRRIGSLGCYAPSLKPKPRTVSPTKTSADASRKLRAAMRARALAYLNDIPSWPGADQVAQLVNLLTDAWDEGFETAFAVDDRRERDCPPEHDATVVEALRNEARGALNEMQRTRAEVAKLRAVAETAMQMFNDCPCDPDTTLRYENSVDAFFDALAAAGLRTPTPSSRAGEEGGGSQ